MKLTDNEKREILKLLENDKPLPDKYRFLLFDDKREVELVWNGKSSEVSNIVLPFQVIEQMDEPRAKGIDLAPKYIPAEVFDKRADERNQVVFHDVAAIEVKPHLSPHLKGGTRGGAVELTDFSVFYSQDSIANAEAAIKNKASRIVVERGQIGKVSKDTHGIVTKEVLTKNWTDWIDYWAVDFNFESKREIIRIPKDRSLRAPAKQSPGVPQSSGVPQPPTSQEEIASGQQQPLAMTGEYEEIWTGDFIFENECQSFRTKKDRSIELKSAFHNCEPGRRKIAVKVVDIFGNDTMTIVDVSIGAKS